MDILPSTSVFAYSEGKVISLQLQSPGLLSVVMALIKILLLKKKKKVLVLRSSQSTGGPNFIQFIQLQALGRKLTSTCRQLMRSFPSARRCSAAEATPSHTSWESGRYGWLVSSMAADVVEDFKHQCSFNFNCPLALAIKAAEWP